MNNEELKIARKIAEIEGLGGDLLSHSDLAGDITCEYNPFDWSILGPLMLKYKVETTNSRRRWMLAIYERSGLFEVKANSQQEVPRAILECIIKANEYQLNNQ